MCSGLPQAVALSSSGKRLGGGAGWELMTPSGNIWCSHGPSFSQSMDNGETVLAECPLSPSSPVPPSFLGPVVGSAGVWAVLGGPEGSWHGLPWGC